MKTHALPGLKHAPSVIALGTGSYGTAIPEADAFRMMDAYVAGGGNFLDTAHVYAAWVEGGQGASERTIGAWLRQSGLRDKVVIGTKGAHHDMKSLEKRVRRDQVARDLTESLERLQLDRVDLYWMHRDDTSVPVGEIMDWLDEHVKAGAVDALGCSNWTPTRIDEANAYARAQHKAPFVASQIGWSLARVKPGIGGGDMLYADDTTQAWHEKSGFAQVAYSSQANGWFGGKYNPDADPAVQRKGVLDKYGTEANYRKLEAANAIAAARGVSANQVALAGLIALPFPFYAITGPRDAAQLADSLAAGSLELTAEEVARLNG